MSNLIITGGNKDFFSYIKKFVTSLRKQGNYSGDLVVCDNDVGGEWNEPGSIKKGNSFNSDQIDLLSERNAKVENYPKLLKEYSIDKNEVEQIKTGTVRHPHKMLYCLLIIEKYKNNVEKICYFDSDVVIQKDISNLFKKIERGKVGLASDNNTKIRKSKVYEWILKTKTEGSFDPNHIFEGIQHETNICSGFIGGYVKDFRSFARLYLYLSTSSFASFFSDQPLVNIICHEFKYPYKMLDSSVLHLGGCNIENVKLEDGVLKYSDRYPVAVHFNGGFKKYYDKCSEYCMGKRDGGYIIDNWLKRLKFKISRLVSK